MEASAPSARVISLQYEVLLCDICGVFTHSTSLTGWRSWGGTAAPATDPAQLHFLTNPQGRMFFGKKRKMGGFWGRLIISASAGFLRGWANGCCRTIEDELTSKESNTNFVLLKQTCLNFFIYLLSTILTWFNQINLQELDMIPWLQLLLSCGKHLCPVCLPTTSGTSSCVYVLSVGAHVLIQMWAGTRVPQQLWGSRVCFWTAVAQQRPAASQQSNGTWSEEALGSDWSSEPAEPDWLWVQTPLNLFTLIREYWNWKLG